MKWWYRCLGGVCTLGVLSALSGCSLILNFEECQSNADCANGVCSEGVCMGPPACQRRSDCADFDPQAYCLAGQCSVVDEDRCELTGGVFETNADRVILPVGGLAPLSGKDESKGRSMLHGADLALRQINRNRGSSRPLFGLIGCDTVAGSTSEVTLSSEERAALAGELAAYLHEDLGVDAIVGAVASGATIEVVDRVASTEDVLVISPASTSPALTNRDDLFWRTIPSDARQAPAMASLVEARGARKVAVLYDREDPYTSEFFNALNLYWNTLPEARRPDVKTGTYTRGAITDSTIQAVSSRALYDSGFKPDAIILLGSSEDLPLLTGLERDYIAALDELQKPIWILPDAMRSQALLESPDAAPAFPRIVGTVPLRVETPIYMAFATNYQSEFGSDPLDFPFTDKAHDAAFLIALAYEVQSDPLSASGSDLAPVLSRVSQGVEHLAQSGGFSSAAGVLRDGGSIDLVGVSGPVDFGPNQDLESAQIASWTIRSSAGAARFVNGDPIDPDAPPEEPEQPDGSQ